MPSLQIRNLPDDLYQALLFRAGQAHRSLAQQALAELREATGSVAHSERQRVLASIKRELPGRFIRKLKVGPESLLRADRSR